LEISRRSWFVDGDARVVAALERHFAELKPSLAATA
jgi:hypothetical protein